MKWLCRCGTMFHVSNIEERYVDGAQWLCDECFEYYKYYREAPVFLSEKYSTFCKIRLHQKRIETNEGINSR